MKKLSYLIVLALILGLVLAGCTFLSNIGQAPTTEQSGTSYLTKGVPMTVVSDDSGATLITKVYNKAGGGNSEVDLSSSPLTAVRAWEPNPYPTDYPIEPIEVTDSYWDNNVNWFEDNGSSADWIWETHLANGPADYSISDPLYDADAAISGRVVLFETTFDIVGDPSSATLYIAADNGYEAWVNSGGTHYLSPTVSGTGWENTSLHQTDLNTSGWQSYGTYTIDGTELINGSNTLYVLAGNEYFWSDDPPNFDNPTRGTTQYNPVAVIFHLDIDYEVVIEEVPEIEVVKVCPPAFAFVGDTLTYNYTVTNTGGGALLDVTLVDDQLGLITLTGLTDIDGIGGANDLAWGESATGTANYVVLEGDTVVENTATASSTSEIDDSLVEATSDECIVQIQICYDETAWALGTSPTENNSVAGNKSEAWGWTNLFTGDGEMVLWAAAGQNDTSKGIQVGTVTVDLDGEGCVTVTYNITADTDYQITEAHLWVGNTPLPIVKQGKKEVPTSAPGQFSKFVDYDSFELGPDGKYAIFVVCGVESSFYVAAHAKIEWCEYPELQ